MFVFVCHVNLLLTPDSLPQIRVPENWWQYSFITIQHINVEGLQRKQSGQWLDVGPMPDTFLVSFGECFEITTNYDGRVQAFEYRVQSLQQEQISIGLYQEGAPNKPQFAYDSATKACRLVCPSFDTYAKKTGY